MFAWKLNVHAAKFICRICQLASFPRPCPAFHHLQYIYLPAVESCMGGDRKQEYFFCSSALNVNSNAACWGPQLTWKRSPSVFLAMGGNTLNKPTTCSISYAQLEIATPQRVCVATSYLEILFAKNCRTWNYETKIGLSSGVAIPGPIRAQALVNFWVPW